MKISIIIPNYNGRALLEKNIPKVINALERYGKNDSELIIVDDGSSDTSIAFLESYKATQKEIPISIIKNKMNVGFSSAVNNGVKEAQGDIIVLFNSDTFPINDFISPLFKHFTNPKLFGVGFMDESVEPKGIVMRGRAIGRWERGFLVHARGETDKKTTLWVSGGSSAFQRELWNKLGGFNELYNPFYYEDIDLSYRALKMGYDIAFDPQIIVKHEHESGAIRSHFSPARVKKITYRNQLFFVWLNITDVDYLLQHMLWLPYHFLNTTRRDKNFSFLYGFLHALQQFPKIVRIRKKLRKEYIISDKNILHTLQS